MQAVFGDLDAMGHVNNVVYLTWIETARIEYWLQIAATGAHPAAPDPSRPSPHPSGLVLSGASVDMILARTEIDYRSPVSYGEKLDVFVRTSLIKRSSLVFDYAIVSRAGERTVAEAKTVIVCYDYARMRSKPVSQALRESILAIDPQARVEI